MSDLDEGDPFADEAGPSRVRPTAVSATSAWFFFGGGTVALGVAVVAGLLAPAVLLDIVALWPIALLAVLVAPVAWFRRARFPVLATVVPLLLLTWVLAGVGWFLADGIGSPPSRAADIEGPDDRPAIGILDVEVDGTLSVERSTGADYRIATALTGGDVTAPEAYEALDGSTLAVLARPRADAGWHDSAGWRLGLRAGPAWQLTLVAASVDADLTSITLSEVSIDADGTVRLPASGGSVSVVDGTLTIVIQPGTTATIEGPAVTPDGFVDAGPDADLAIVVEGGDVTVEVVEP